MRRTSRAVAATGMAGAGAVAAGVLAALFLLDGEAGLAGLSLGLCGALIGFLAHNYPPVRIFMGDSGSLFLGIVLAGLALAPAPGLSRSLLAVVSVPVIILSIPILDTTFVTVSRLLEGRPVAEGGRDHTSHGLVALGVSGERAVWTLWILALAAGLVGSVLRSADRALAGIVGGLPPVGLALVGTYLLSARYRRGGQDHGDAGPGKMPDAEAESGASAVHDRILTFHERLPVLKFALDVVLVGLAYYGAYLIRWEPAELADELEYFRSTVALVVAAKLLVFAWVGIYGARWRNFGMEDALRVIRASFFGTILTAALLLLVARLGLSRGVLLVDFGLCSALILGARFSFRIFEGAARRLASDGEAVVLVGPPGDAELILREVRRVEASGFRLVAVADPSFGPARGRFRGHPLYGGRNGLSDALRETGAPAVVVARRGEDEEWSLPEAVRDHLDRHGAPDAYVLDVRLKRWSSGLVGDRTVGEQADEAGEAGAG